MSMLLTLSQSTHGDLGGGRTSSIHEFPAKFNHLRFRASPLSKLDQQVTAPPPRRDIHLEEEKPVPATLDMATPHRGLPPPSAMQLPEPSRPPPQPVHAAYTGQNLAAMPAPPNHWQGQEESMRNWLHAKAEEDRRKQEEEKTRQETLKLEQRRIEQSMLRESLQGGVPPQMIPIIYAGMGGGALVQLSAEWLHQYASQLQYSQQQQLQQAPDSRSQRMIGEVAYAYPPTTQAAHTAEAATAPGIGQPYSAYPRPGPTSAPRSIAQASLPRLSTNDMYAPPPPVPGSGSAHPLQPSQAHGQEPASSPLIYFHHWVPPGGESSKAPQTPATKVRQDEPMSARPGSQLSDGESRDSPRKRKAQGEHRPNPPPTSVPQYGSPSFSTASTASTKRASGHSRNRSTISFKEESRPDSRREEYRFFAPAAVQEEDERRPERVPERREEATAAGANVASQHESRQQSPQRVSASEEQGPIPRSDQQQQQQQQQQQTPLPTAQEEAGPIS